MIEVKLDEWNEIELQDRVVDKVADKIIPKEFKLYGNIPEEGCYTPYDKFKNYIANLVADRIFEFMIGNEEIQKRIDKAIENAEKTIISFHVKKLLNNQKENNQE